MAGTLDMALDDVIKKGGGSGGKRQGGRLQRKGGAGDGGRKMAQKKASSAPDAPKPKEENRKGLLERVSFVKGIAGAALRMASKAAGAAAKATATGKTQSTTGRSEAAKAAAAAGKAAPAGRRTKAGGGSIESTAAKLSMTLDDICKTEVQGKRQPRGEGKVAAGRAVGGRKMRLKLRRDGNLKRKVGGGVGTRAQGKTKAGAKGAVRGGARQAGGRGTGAGWYEPPSTWAKGKGKGSRKGDGKGRGGDWGAWTEAPRKRWSDDWSAPPAKRARASSWEAPSRGGDYWGGRDRDEYHGGKGGGRSAPRPPMDFHDHRGGHDDRWSGDWDAPRRAPEARGALAWDRPEPRERMVRREDPWERVAAPAARASRSGETCRVKVTNVPLDLDRHDIKEAFEERGRVVRCEVDRGVATITFEEPRDAKQAVQTFDRGELNGQTIFVCLD